jgi:hypothetical protein
MTQVANDTQKTIEVHFAEPLNGKNLSFKTATKTKSIQAKPLASVLSDKNILTKFLLDTLEGRQALQEGGQTVICLGGGGDVWQQKTSKLLQKYTVVNITEDGWLVCDPKPENEVWASQYTGESRGDDKFSIFAQWGEKTESGQYIQTGEVGDYILRSKTDPNDYWIVRKSFFESTYEFKEV